MKLPTRYNYAEAFLTFDCNLNCGYCINKHGKLKPRKELSAEQWATGLNRIDFGDVPITIGGGEPTLHPGFYNILHKLNPTRVDLLTNLSFNPNIFMKLAPKEMFNNNDNPAYKSIRVSFHPTKQDAGDLVMKASVLQENGYDVGIFGINHPENYKANVEMSEMARQNNLYFFIGDFLGEYGGTEFGHLKYPDGIGGKKQKVLCRGKTLLIAPDGDIHRCHRDLYHNEYPIGNILNTDLKIDDKFKPCHNFGECNPCDLKLRANRFLQVGDCNMEIVK